MSQMTSMESYGSSTHFGEYDYSASSEISKFAELFPNVDVTSLVNERKRMMKEPYPSHSKGQVARNTKSSSNEDELYHMIHNFASEFVFYFERMKHQKEKYALLENENQILKRKLEDESKSNKTNEFEKDDMLKRSKRYEKEKKELLHSLNKQQELYNLKENDFQLLRRKYQTLLMRQDQQQKQLEAARKKNALKSRPYPKEVDWKKKYFESEELRQKLLQEKITSSRRKHQESTTINNTSSLTDQQFEELKSRFEILKSQKEKQDSYLENLEASKKERERKIRVLEEERSHLEKRFELEKSTIMSVMEKQKSELSIKSKELNKSKGEFQNVYREFSEMKKSNHQSIDKNVHESMKRENDELKKRVNELRTSITDNTSSQKNPSPQKSKFPVSEEEMKGKNEYISQLEKDRMFLKSENERWRNESSQQLHKFRDLVDKYEQVNRDKDKQHKIIRSLKIKLKDTSKKKFLTEEKNKKLMQIVNDQKEKITHLHNEVSSLSRRRPSPPNSRERMDNGSTPGGPSQIFRPTRVALPGLTRVPAQESAHPNRSERTGSPSRKEELQRKDGSSQVTAKMIESIEKENATLKRTCEKREQEIQRVLREMNKVKDQHKRSVEAFSRSKNEEISRLSSQQKELIDKIKQFQVRCVQVQKQRDRNKQLSEKYKKLYSGVHRKNQILAKQHKQLKGSYDEMEKQDEMIRECYNVVMTSEKKLKRKLKHLKKDIRVYGTRYQKQTKRIKEENQKLEEECKRCKRIILKLRNEKPYLGDPMKRHPTLVKDVELIRTREILSVSRKENSNLKIQIGALKEEKKKSCDDLIRKNENLEENLRRLKVAYIDITKKKNAIFKTLTQENEDLKEDMKKQINKKLLMLKKNLSKEKSRWLKVEEKKLEQKTKKEVEKINQALEKNSELEENKLQKIRSLQEEINELNQENSRIKEKYRLLKMFSREDKKGSVGDDDVDEEMKNRMEFIQNMMIRGKEEKPIDISVYEEEHLDDHDDLDDDEEEEEEDDDREIDLRDLERKDFLITSSSGSGATTTLEYHNNGGRGKMEKEKEFEMYRSEMEKLNEKIRSEMDSLKT